MRTPSTCANLPKSFFSFASTGRSGTLPAGLAARCFTFNQPAGTGCTWPTRAVPGTCRARILNAQFQPVCSVRYLTECTLKGPGRTGSSSRETYGNEAAYTLKMPRISQAVGCPALPLAAVR